MSRKVIGLTPDCCASTLDQADVTVSATRMAAAHVRSESEAFMRGILALERMASAPCPRLRWRRVPAQYRGHESTHLPANHGLGLLCRSGRDESSPAGDRRPRHAWWRASRRRHDDARDDLERGRSG